MTGTGIMRLFVLMAATFVTSAAIADEPAAEPSVAPPARGETPPRGRRAAVAEAEEAARDFARTHHPELANLLERLRRANPRAYRAAIIDLSKDRVRLERLQERAPERYEYELQLWTMDSQVRLLAARAGRGNADEIRPRLKELMQQRQEFRLNHLRQERERLAARLERVDGQIAEIESRPTADADVDALLARVKTRVQAGQGRTETSASVPPPEAPAAGTADDAQTESQSPSDSPQD
jgi:hypothetical protein